MPLIAYLKNIDLLRISIKHRNNAGLPIFPECQLHLLAFIEINGKTIIKNQIEVLQEIFEEVIIITNSPREYRHLKVRVVKDIVPEKGPLGGIYSGLLSSENFYNFFLACDMPFPNMDLIAYMKGLVDDYDVVVPRTKSGYETLCAFYSKDCLSSIKRQMDIENLRIVDFLSQVKVRVIEAGELAGFDPEGVSFLNVNTLEDLERARSIALR